MEETRFRQLLLADVALELGVVAEPDAAKVLARRIEAGDDVIDSVPEADRPRVLARVERLLAEAGGDAQAAVARRDLPAELHAGTPRADAAAPAPLRCLDERRYIGFQPVGEGGMGVVYVALDTVLNRHVAFKMIRTASKNPLGTTPTAPGEEMVTRFLQEAWVTGRLEHPGIVPLYELGETPSGVPYYTMRLVKGKRTLEDAISEAKTLEARLALLEPFLRVCDTVRYANSNGVVHRDLKPSNVALGEFGEVVVLDWGLAKVEERPTADRRWRGRIEELRRETDVRTRAALGTLGYMSPEAELDPRSVSARSDVFSLGAMLFRILAGKLPFRTTGPHEYLVDVAAGVTGIPGAPSGLGPICLKALAREPGERYADAGELAAAVRRWQGESAVEREVQALFQEAEAAMKSAGRAHGQALLSQFDRALAVSARILDLRPDHQGAREIQDRARRARAGAIAERERVARRGLLRRVAVFALVISAATAAVVVIELNEARRDTEAALSRELDARTNERVLSDNKEAADLLAEESELWPVHPDRAEVMSGWLERARALLQHRSAREEALARIRERGEPHLEEERSPAEGNAGRGNVAAGRRTAFHADPGNTDAKNPEDGARHRALSDLLLSLDRLAASVEQVERRYEEASTLADRSIAARRADWDDATTAAGMSPRYGGLDLAPQLGLVPLGPDPESGLLEFAHLGSGTLPARDPSTRRLVFVENSAIVLVLIPGATFQMGAQKTDPNGPNFDPEASDDEGPVHEVTLTPYFISKYECTQAQWERITGSRPSWYGPGSPSSATVTPRNPVERVSWHECRTWLRRVNLTLPTEAQWEYACRALTQTPWSCPSGELRAAANLDSDWTRGRVRPLSEFDAMDQTQVHIVVGSLEPNAFGLHDMHGNVCEWCEDVWGRYGTGTDPRCRVFRGGYYGDLAAGARSAHRGRADSRTQHPSIGVRPARALMPPRDPASPVAADGGSGRR